MFHIKFFIMFLLVSVVELTPIVTLPPEKSAPTSTNDENLQTFTVTVTPTLAEAVISQVSANVTSAPEEEESITQENVTEAGQIDNSEPVVVSIIKATNNSNNGEALGGEPVNRVATTVLVNQTEGQEATTPELITNTTVPTTNIEVTQLSVTSNPISLKKGLVVEKLEQTVVPPISTDVIQTENVTNQVKIIINVTGNNVSNETTEGDYRDKAPPEYHPYIEEILRADTINDNDTSTKSAPIRIKSQSHQSPQNAIDAQPYGPLPEFAEKEMDKLRLNHWRVHQILKGGLHENSRPGLSGTGNDNLQGKYNHQPPHFLGQKRASSTSAAAVKSSVDQDEFHSSILASEHDAVLMEKEKSQPSKLRTFFNWISNPLKKKPNEKEDERLRQARAQQPILPFALGYRGDFLFW